MTGVGEALRRGIGAGLLGLATLAAGCAEGEPAPAGPAFRGLTLTVAAVGDPELLEAVRTQGGEWAAQHGVALEIRTEPIDPARAAAEADLIVFPGDRLGALIDAGALVPLPERFVRSDLLEPGPTPDAPEPRGGSGAGPHAYEPGEGGPRRDPLDFVDVLPAFRDEATRYGEARYGLPLGGSALVLAYRRDAFESPPARAAAAEAGLALAPPDTWAQLDALARFFREADRDGDGRPDGGIALALGADPEGVADAAFLARAAALGLPPDRFEFLFDSETLEPRLGTEPFVEALRAHVALKDAGPEGLAGFDAEAARRAFREGRAALLIDRAERANAWTDPAAPASIGVVPLPGSARYFDAGTRAWRDAPAGAPNRPAFLPRGGGWLAGVSTRTDGPARAAALSYLRDLAGAELAGGLVSDPAFPMSPVRASHLGLGLPDPRAALGVDGRAWGRAVQQTYSAPRVAAGLRIPEADGYLADLARARLAALEGADPAEALAEAARAWDARSGRLGRDRQLWHYRRSLNRLSTPDRPPPRPAGGADAGAG